ncbi:DUF1573 domain-containing protein [Chitinophaga silvatica]|uniref:DUF1573 domain-containing protein n=1 Tax=Chitinophaga silvatica TaxID=2282649 RepID=A0A3E1Y412_9BACT|nr:DUF1573 domain-containing protein [Chitinophaga silvatica]RFS19421.1 DUF1573 domain-containing protein [Chitinophaga silvatica]
MKSIYIAIILLIGVNLLLVLANLKEKKKNEQLKSTTDERYSSLQEVWNFSLQYSGNIHANFDALISDQNNSYKLGDYLNHKQSMLLLRLPQDFCDKCLGTELPKLAKVAKIIGKSNIILLSNQANYNEILQLARVKDTTFRVMYLKNTDKLFLDLNEVGSFLFPYFFTLDSSGIVKSIFPTNSSHPELSNPYYESIIKRWGRERDFSQISSNQTQIEFDMQEHNFGSIPSGKEAICIFKFRNTGEQPLSIVSINTGCGCTAADYPLTQIPAGDSASISITYDAKTAGIFNRPISVVTNAIKSPTILMIKGLVKP